VFQVGLNEAYDVLYAEFLKAQAPRIEIQVEITIPAGTTQLTPAQMGISDFGDFVWLSERVLGSNDKYIDLEPVDRLAQRPPFTLLKQFNYRDGTFFFIGATNNIDMLVRYDTSGQAPVSDGTKPSCNAQITVDSSQNFLANYTVSVIGPRKGYDEIAADCRNLAMGSRYNSDAIIGGQLYSLLSPLVRSRQNVQVAPKPFTAARRLGLFWATPYIAAQQGATGGGSQNVPVQFSSTNGGIIGAIDGINNTFVVNAAVLSMSVYVNQGLQVQGVDYVPTNNQMVFNPASIPQPGSSITAQCYLLYQN
jgi:hypothetical protein